MNSSRKRSTSKSGVRRSKLGRKPAAKAARKSATTVVRAKRARSSPKKSGKATTRTRSRARSAQPRSSGRSQAQVKSRSSRSATTAKRSQNSSSQRTRGKIVHAPALRKGRKTQPPQGRPRSQPTPALKALQDGIIPATPVEKPVDPLLVESRLQLQRQAARAPLMPHSTSTIRPMPPRSGKPLWRLPHSR